MPPACPPGPTGPGKGSRAGTPPSARRHLAQNPFICDCNLKWLADFLRSNPVETSGARCASPRRLANKRIGQIKSKKFRCSGQCPPRPVPPRGLLARPRCPKQGAGRLQTQPEHPGTPLWEAE